METLRVSLLLRIPELSQGNVKIADPERVCDKLRKMSQGTHAKLQTVFDFDKTITKPTVDGKTAVGSLEIVKIMEGVPMEMLLKGRDVMLAYYMYIKETEMSDEERIKYTDQTMDTIEQLFRSVPIPDDTPLRQTALGGQFLLREGAEETFKVLSECSVPLLVLSGGLTCVIDAVLRDKSLITENVHIMSNSFKYKDGYIDGFSIDRVHFFNKSIRYLASQLYKEELSKRPNIILVGDAAADGLMVEGVPETFNVLKIGFYHENLWDDNFKEFQRYFDIVVTEDETMSVVNAILKYVLGRT